MILQRHSPQAEEEVPAGSSAGGRAPALPRFRGRLQPRPRASPPGRRPPGPAYLDLWKKLNEDTSYAALSSTALASPLYRTLRLYSLMAPRPRAGYPPGRGTGSQGAARHRPSRPPPAADGSTAGFLRLALGPLPAPVRGRRPRPNEGFSCPGCRKEQPEARARGRGRVLRVRLRSVSAPRAFVGRWLAARKCLAFPCCPSLCEGLSFSPWPS